MPLTQIILIIYQIQVPLSVIVAWIMGIQMDLDFSLLETGSLAFSIIVTAFALQVLNLSTLWMSLIIMLNIVGQFLPIKNNNNMFLLFFQDGTSHYMKGVVLFLCYIVISACFFVHKIPPPGKCLAKMQFLTM